MKIKLTRPQVVTILVLSLLVAFVLLVNFVLEFQKISSRKHITQSLPSQSELLEEYKDGQASSSLRKYTFKRKIPFGQADQASPTQQKGEGVVVSDPLKYGTITIIKEDGTEMTLEEAQAQAASAQAKLQKQAAPVSQLAQRVQDIMSSFDSAMQEKINEAIKDPTLIPQVIRYTEQEISACNTALAQDENNLEAVTKKERLMVLKSILLSTLNK